MPDYIPDSDAEFNAWLANFISSLGPRKVALGVADAEFSALEAARDTWDGAYGQHTATQAAAAARSQTKQQARENLEDKVRATVRRLQTHPSITDADRAALRITIPTAARREAGAPTSRPVPQVDTGQRLRHTISFTDESTPNSRAKPAGVRGCEIYGKVADSPPADPSGFDFLALDTSTPYVAEYAGAEAGKTAHYVLRWVNSRDEKGPWSQTVSATITG